MACQSGAQVEERPYAALDLGLPHTRSPEIWTVCGKPARVVQEGHFLEPAVVQLVEPSITADLDLPSNDQLSDASASPEHTGYAWRDLIVRSSPDRPAGHHSFAGQRRADRWIAVE